MRAKGSIPDRWIPRIPGLGGSRCAINTPRPQLLHVARHGAAKRHRLSVPPAPAETRMAPPALQTQVNRAHIP